MQVEWEYNHQKNGSRMVSRVEVELSYNRSRIACRLGIESAVEKKHQYSVSIIMGVQSPEWK